MKKRIAHIVDDDPDILDSVSFILRSRDIATTTHLSSEAFLEALPGLEPGCIILDIAMPGMNGLQLQAHLHRHGCHMPVIIITGHADITSAVTAMKEGALDFIQKPFTKEELFGAVEAAWTELDRPSLDPEQCERARQLVARLTKREQQVIAGLIKGHQNKTIAYDLGISPRTVELYRANAAQKLKARSLSEMLQVAFYAGLA